MNTILRAQTSRLLIVALVLLCVNSVSYGQNLKKPTLLFTAPCASENFNQYKVNFSWDPPLVSSTNTFTLELSDASGSFSSPTTLTTVSNMNTTLNFDFTFSFPTNTAGNNFRVRVRSSNPALISPESIHSKHTT